MKTLRPQKIKEKVQELREEIHNREENCGKVRLMFQDEAGFGRINKPKYCWCEKGIRPCVPCHHIREYRYAYGAVEPLTGDTRFLVMPYCNTVCMNLFLREFPLSAPGILHCAPALERFRAAKENGSASFRAEDKKRMDYPAKCRVIHS